MLSLSHWIGGDARRRRKIERGRFGANSFGTEPPRSVLGGFADRVAPDLAGNPLEARSTHLRQDEHTLDRDPRPMAQARATFGRSKARTNRARGWEAKGNSLGKRNAQRQRPRAEGQRTIQPTLGTTLALAPRRGGSGIGKAFEKRLPSPKRRRAAPDGEPSEARVPRLPCNRP